MMVSIFQSVNIHLVKLKIYLEMIIAAEFHGDVFPNGPETVFTS